MSDFLPTRCQGVSRFFASHATQLAQLCLVRISPSSLQVFAPPALPWLGLPPHHTTTQPDTPAWHLSFPPSRLVLFGPDHTTLFPSSPYEYTLRWCVGHHLGKDRAEPDQNLSPLPSLMPLPAAPCAITTLTGTPPTATVVSIACNHGTDPRSVSTRWGS
jgi:hypothetical protein